MTSERRYAALPIIVNALRVVAVFFFACAGLGLVTTVREAPDAIRNLSPTAGNAAIMAGALAVFFFVACGIVVLGAGEVFEVAMDIEANTRRAAERAMFQTEEQRELAAFAHL